MAMDTVISGSISRMRKDALEAVNSLPLPGVPDEAWRRVPPEAVKAVTAGGKAASGEMYRGAAVTLTGDGGLYKATGGEENRQKLDNVLELWRSYEDQRCERRLTRPNDVEHNLASSINMAFSDDLYLIQFGGKEDDDIQQGRAEIVLNPVYESVPVKTHLSLLIVHVLNSAEAKLEVVFPDVSDQDHQMIFQIVCILEDNARLSVLFHDAGGNQRNLFSFERAYLGQRSYLKIGREMNPEGTAMTDSRCALLGRSAELEYYTLQQPRGNGFAGQKIVVEQYAPHTRSKVETRSVADDKSRCLFAGAVKIPSGAEGSEAFEQHRSLLLGPGAKVQSLPELEIVENDVSCSHASSISDLDFEDLFYLESRGIPPSEARQLLTEAFIFQVQSKLRLAL